MRRSRLCVCAEHDNFVADFRMGDAPHRCAGSLRLDLVTSALVPTVRVDGRYGFAVHPRLHKMGAFPGSLLNRFIGEVSIRVGLAIAEKVYSIVNDIFFVCRSDFLDLDGATRATSQSCQSIAPTRADWRGEYAPL